MLGLLEVDRMQRNIESLDNREFARIVLDGSATTAARFRTYILVRTEMSLLTGMLVAAFAWLAGLQFAVGWGVIGFSLNYITFLRPFIANLFLTLRAVTQFDSWRVGLAVFDCLD